MVRWSEVRHGQVVGGELWSGGRRYVMVRWSEVSHGQVGGGESWSGSLT